MKCPFPIPKETPDKERKALISAWIKEANERAKAEEDYIRSLKKRK